MTNNKICNKCNKCINNNITNLMHLYFCNEKYCNLNFEQIFYFANCAKLLNEHLNNIKKTNNINNIKNDDIRSQILLIKQFSASFVSEIEVTDNITKAIKQNIIAIIESTDENQCLELIVLLSILRKIRVNYIRDTNLNTFNMIFIKFLNKDFNEVNIQQTKHNLFVFTKLNYFSDFKNNIDDLLHVIPNDGFDKIIKSCYKIIKNNNIEPEQANILFKNKAIKIISDYNSETFMPLNAYQLFTD